MKICLGVSGGIAAYKSAELLRRFQEQGHEVQVVMTRHARKFITPLTLASLSGRKVITGMFDGPGGEANIESAIEHIAVAQGLDALVVAPATANVLAKMARGIADDFLTTLYLATTAPVVVAPAMNVNMWNHPAVQENLDVLRSRRVRLVAPDEGYLACGMTGPGRLASVDAIVAAVNEVLSARHDLAGDTILVTAGPTQEPLDPVRFIGNRSSGKMGYAIAEAAARRGARVVLVSGPTRLDPPAGVELLKVRTAEEMYSAVLAGLNEATIIIKVAAVADYRPTITSEQKIKKTDSQLTIELERTPDILAEVARRKGTRLVIGFAAETERLLDNARDKLRTKNLDMVVANDVTQGVFGSDEAAAVLVTATNEIELPRMSKRELAQRILDQVAVLRARQVSAHG